MTKQKERKISKKEYEKAMREMECWDVQNHLTRCKKCRLYLDKLNDITDRGS